MPSSIAVRYAKALLDAAEEMQLRTPVDAGIELLASIFLESQGLDLLLQRASRMPGAAS
jgi:hypothetical protein